MTSRFSPAAGIRLLVVVLGLAIPATGRTQTPAACTPGTPAPQAMASLVEETEATGMPDAILKRLLAAGYQDDQAQEALRAILCTVVDAEERGLPMGTIFDTIQEGVGKRVPPASILLVVQDRVRDLDFARRLLARFRDVRPDSPNVERLGRALSLKVSKAEASHLFGTRVEAPVEMRLIAAEILGYGRALEIPPDLLDLVIRTGLTHQAFTPDWSYFIKVVSAARKSGIPDAHTVQVAVAVLEENGSIDEVAGELAVDLRSVIPPAADQPR